MEDKLIGRCPHCDDTGDVHRFDGEWLGVCFCPAGDLRRNPKAQHVHEWANWEPDWMFCVDANCPATRHRNHDPNGDT